MAYEIKFKSQWDETGKGQICRVQRTLNEVGIQNTELNNVEDLDAQVKQISIKTNQVRHEIWRMLVEEDE
jgi:hypothetical protein